MQQGPDPRAAPRADEAEAHADHAEAALAVCLQQPSFRGPNGRVAIRLMAVSKRLAALVTRCCGGAVALLLLLTRLDKPALAGALASWLSHHGTLLAELELVLCDRGHPAVRVLEQLPSSLTHLTVTRYFAEAVAAQQAAALVRALSRQPMQLHSLKLLHSWQDQAATVLPALAALRQLSSLAMWVSGDLTSQLPVQHLPAQLQQLDLRLCSTRPQATNTLPWLALEHVTGLTRLSIQNACVDGSVLPRGLESLAVADVSDTAALQPLEQLTALQLCRWSASAEQLRQLSTLRRLEQLSVTADKQNKAGDLSDALAALAVLPLTHLSTQGQKLTAACLAHLGACTRLTSLELLTFHLAADAAAPAQLAAAVARMTALERVELMIDVTAGGSGARDAWRPTHAAGWTAVGNALARLPGLTDCRLELPRLRAAAAHLAAATQLTRLRLWWACLDDSCLATICAGLTALRHLDLRGNVMSDEFLSSIAGMPQLTFLDVTESAVTQHGVQQLLAVRPQLQIEWGDRE